MAKPEWGVKRACPSCAARFYDLMRDPVVCPACGTAFPIDAFSRPRRGKGAAPAVKAVEPKAPIDEETDIETTSSDDDDDDVLDLDDDDDTVDDALPETSSDESDDEDTKMDDFSDNDLLNDDDDDETSGDDDDEVSLEDLDEGDDDLDDADLEEDDKAR